MSPPSRSQAAFVLCPVVKIHGSWKPAQDRYPKYKCPVIQQKYSQSVARAAPSDGRAVANILTTLCLLVPSRSNGLSSGPRSKDPQHYCCRRNRRPCPPHVSSHTASYVAYGPTESSLFWEVATHKSERQKPKLQQVPRVGWHG